MDIQALKIELAKQIRALESKEILDKVYATLNREEKDFWMNLSEDLKKEVEVARKQVKKGLTADWYLVRSRPSTT
jgi:hypothetical protein